MKYLCRFICLLIPKTKWKKAFKKYYKSKIDIRSIQKRYQKRIQSLKSKEKVTIAFLVWENSKWSYDSLYQKLQSDKKFQPIVMIKTENHLVCNLEKNKKFFKDKRYNYTVISSLRDFKKYKPDIVFYEQPWFCLNGDFSPANISSYSVCMYVPYGVEVDINMDLFNSIKRFYQGCYQTFVFNQIISEKMNKLQVSNTIPIGYPKLEIYLEKAKHNPWKYPHKTKIIFAPHHSFANSILKWGTYEWSGDYLYQLALKTQKVTEWVFKPHPRFYTALIEEFGQVYADKVFNDWAKVSTLCDTGNYFDLFKTADLLISDCGSFRTEWLPTKKPYLYLLSNYKGVEPLSEFEQYFYGGYYFAKNIQEIEKYFNLLVFEKQDPLKEKREKLADEIPMNSTDIIYNYINKLIER